MIKNKEYTSVDCVWLSLYAYVKVRISPVSNCPVSKCPASISSGEHTSAHRIYYQAASLCVLRSIECDLLLQISRGMCACLCGAACVLDTLASPAKTDGPIEMPFGM